MSPTSIPAVRLYRSFGISLWNWCWTLEPWSGRNICYKAHLWQLNNLNIVVIVVKTIGLSKIYSSSPRGTSLLWAMAFSDCFLSRTQGHDKVPHKPCSHCFVYTVYEHHDKCLKQSLGLGLGVICPQYIDYKYCSSFSLATGYTYSLHGNPRAIVGCYESQLRRGPNKNAAITSSASSSPSSSNSSCALLKLGLSQCTCILLWAPNKIEEFFKDGREAI